MKTNHIVKSRDIIWSNTSYGEWIKSKDSLKKIEDDLSASEVEADGSKVQKEPELPAKRNEARNNKKALKQILN
jgi:hypothetical protein